MIMPELHPGLQAHPSGALWLPAAGAALLADVHLGYAWAMRRRGQLGPPVSAGVGERLERLLQELQPRLLVVLGDLVHAPRPGAEEQAAIERQIASLRAHAGLLLVRGNHDRGFARDFAHLELPAVEEWAFGGWRAVHGDQAGPGQRLILGHFHPAVSIRDAAGARMRLPAFLVFPNAVVLPAFSPLAAGFDVRRGLPAGLRAIVGAGRPGVWATSGTAVARVR